ncbi:MAG: hypothetical protein LH472_08475 [Pyrinomonadaceae bacterium]|nr:hypothetical protein [Pyrinomonadaceae bacterium]
MPISVSKTVGGQAHAPVFVGEILASDVVNVVVTALSTAEVDTKGFLKPGVPFSKAGALVGAAVPVYGVTIESIKVAASNSAADIAAAAAAVPVAVGTIGTVNRDIAEDNLGRVYTAAEIAGFDLAGSKLHLTRT